MCMTIELAASKKAKNVIPKSTQIFHYRGFHYVFCPHSLGPPSPGLAPLWDMLAQPIYVLDSGKAQLFVSPQDVNLKVNMSSPEDTWRKV